MPELLTRRQLLLALALISVARANVGDDRLPAGGAAKSGNTRAKHLWTCLTVLLALWLKPGLWASEVNCAQTAWAVHRASVHEIMVDYWIALGNSYNLLDESAREEQLEEAELAYQEAVALAQDQLQARLEICDQLGFT